MPYSSTKSLPPAAKNLPEAAKKIWLAAFNASFERYGEQKAFAIAMAAVKNKYRQVNGEWMAKDAGGGNPCHDPNTGEFCGEGGGAAPGSHKTEAGRSKMMAASNKAAVKTRAEMAARGTAGANLPRGAPESSHPTHPLPNSPGGGRAVYDLPPSGPDDEHQTIQIERRPDGSYYGTGESFDFERSSPGATREQLKKWRAKYVGWENKRDAGADHQPELPLSDRELPLEVKTMPAAARAIFKAVFRRSLKEEPDQMAAMLALAAVKKEFTMEGEEWVKKEEAEAARVREAAELAAAAGEAAGDPDDPEAGEGTGEGAGEASEARTGSGEASGEAGNRKKTKKPDEGGAYTKKTRTTETTETRGGATDSIQMTEVFALDAPTSERFGMRTTSSGYLVAEPRVARIGIQIYKGFEVGRPDMDEVRVYRPEAEVFDTRAMSSLAHRPVTFDHPDTNVDPSNWREYSVGHSTGDVARDGDFIRVPLALMDQAAIDAAKSGHSQLSVGYGAKLRWGQGETTDGQLYDAMQTDIRANHIALVRTARGGDKLRMGDSHEKRRSPMTDRTINLDGVNVALEDKDAQILERHLSGLGKKLADQGEDVAALKKKIAELEAALAKATGDSAAKDGEIVVLKKKVEDGKLTDEEVDRRVHERLDVVGRASRFLPDGWTDAKKGLTQIRREVAAAHLGDQRAKELSDEAIVGAFLSITDEPSQNDGIRRLATSFSRPPSNYNDAAAKAYDKRNEELQNRWKANRRPASGGAQ